MVSMIYVESSNVQAVGYDENQSILIVEFKHGGTYHYYGVDKNIYEGMLCADSKGTYLNEYVKKAGYSYTRV